MFSIVRKYLDRETVRRHEENVAIVALRGARASVDVLRTAAGKGHDVSEALEKAEAEIRRIAESMPRGDGFSFFFFVLFQVFLVVILPLSYPGLVRSALGRTSGQGFDSGGLANLGRHVMDFGATLTGSPWTFAGLGLLVVVNVYFVQRILFRRHARAFLLVAVAASMSFCFVLMAAPTLLYR